MVPAAGNIGIHGLAVEGHRVHDAVLYRVFAFFMELQKCLLVKAAVSVGVEPQSPAVRIVLRGKSQDAMTHGEREGLTAFIGGQIDVLQGVTAGPGGPALYGLV